MNVGLVARAFGGAPPKRLSVEKLPNGVDLINDAYNARTRSMRAGKDALADVADLRRRANP